MNLSLRNQAPGGSILRKSAFEQSPKLAAFLPKIPNEGSTRAPRAARKEYERVLHQTRERRWMRFRGKHGCIDFTDEERFELRRYFDSLDKNGSGSIGVAELEETLISLGLADTRQDVLAFVAAVDEDDSGRLDFEEYLTIIRIGEADSAIFQVFKAMMNGKLGDKNLNFPNVISTYRRKVLLDAIGVSGGPIGTDDTPSGAAGGGPGAAGAGGKGAAAGAAVGGGSHHPRSGSPGNANHPDGHHHDGHHPPGGGGDGGSAGRSSSGPDHRHRSEGTRQDRGGRILKNFANMIHDRGEGDALGEGMNLGGFNLPKGAAGAGALSLVWRHFCNESKLMSGPRPQSTGEGGGTAGRGVPALEPPPSPRSVLRQLQLRKKPRSQPDDES